MDLKHKRPKAKSQWPTAAFSHTPATYPVAMCCARMHPFQGHTLVHGGRGNWDPNGRSQTTEVQAFLGFPAQLLRAQTADIPGAAPVNVFLTLDEYLSKVNDYFSVLYKTM